jgi:hypothetical protein
MRQIEVSVDVFAGIWRARLPHERTEDDILARLLLVRPVSPQPTSPAESPTDKNSLSGPAKPTRPGSQPASKRWRDVLEWALRQLGGKGTLEQIYAKTREGRAVLGLVITAEHNASARECLESHCSESQKFRGKADLFFMPEGKGAGVWAVR